MVKLIRFFLKQFCLNFQLKIQKKGCDNMILINLILQIYLIRLLIIKIEAYQIYLLIKD